MPADRPVSLLRIVSAALLMVAATLAVAALGEWLLIPSSAVREVDAWGVTHGIAALAGHPRWHDAAVLWAVLSGPWFVYPVVALLGGVLAVRRRITARAAVVTVAIGLAGWGLGVGCKLLVERPRPLDAVVEVGGWSYPSGHATNIAVGTVLVIALVQVIRSAWMRWGATVLALLGAGVTAADRILLGVHNISDVVMGLVLGAAIALLGLVVLPSSLPSSRPASPQDQDHDHALP
ncbi:phosphatase PAP2 family protein [Janibacter sp. Soil728]|uniref:phosphatase PAP2 family protein n=1 Tax=Janibacter sp. Soil728 TaxID=1736393 RepID=UPI00138F39CB|nr:phosphatase PAP2 family protein [Janibacter sp. Soil728]